MSTYCRLFQSGRCRDGDRCPFRHEHAPECKWLAAGLPCRDGARCPYTHHGQAADKVVLTEASLAVGHIPVLRDESINALLSGPDGADGSYVDGTFGRGGHSTEILRRLSADGRLWAFDVDPLAVHVGQKLMDSDRRFAIIHRPFADVHAALPKGLELSGMLIDIGFSSPQVDDGARGWSVDQDGPLDLRMNFESGVPAAKWLQTVGVSELAWVIRENGEDDDPILCARLAEAILERQRRCGQYTSTLQLGACVAEVKRHMDDRGQHPAKLVFQSIRTFLNQEMEQLRECLQAQFRRLKYGGRAVVVTFKPSEEAVLSRFLREHQDGWAHPLSRRVSPERLAELFPLLQKDLPYAVRRLGSPVRPSHREIELNRRSRSAMVHTLVKELRLPPPTSVGAIAPVGLRPGRGMELVRPTPPPLGPEATPLQIDGYPVVVQRCAEVSAPNGAYERVAPNVASRIGDVCSDTRCGTDGLYNSGCGVPAVDMASCGGVGGHTGGGLYRPGDWRCRSCGDMVFARRLACRMCGTPR